MISPTRFRLKFTKTGDLRFIGHLDLQRLFERALRRTNLPLKYSQGFSPKVRINIAGALPLGFISEAEMLDFWLEETREPEVVRSSLQAALPLGIEILDTQIIDNNLPSLQASLKSSIYKIVLPQTENFDHVLARMTSLLAHENIFFQRRKKKVDIKPMLEKWDLVNMDGCLLLFLHLAATPELNGRPDEFLKLIGRDPADCIVERMEMIFTN